MEDETRTGLQVSAKSIKKERVHDFIILWIHKDKYRSGNTQYWFLDLTLWKLPEPS